MELELWLRIGHVIGVLLWVAGLSTVYWLLRIHAQTPKEVHEKLVLLERAVALSMDLAAALAIGTGLGLALNRTPTLFAAPGAGWFHIKLTVVVLGVLSVHGLVRARVGKFSRGQVSDVPHWLWGLLLVSLTAIVILVFRGPLMFAK